MVESRGNRNYTNNEGKHIGIEHFGSTLHFGPAWNNNGYWSSTFATRSDNGNGFNNDFHKFGMHWLPNYIAFSVDDKEIGRVEVGNGFWERGKFEGEDIWAKNGTKAAPFDEFVRI